MQETIKPVGKVEVILYDKDGKVKEERFRHNMLMRGGRDWLCAHIGGGTGASQMHFIAIGSGGSTVAASTQTQLYGEEARSDEATYAHTADTASFSLTKTFIAGVGTGAIDEAGVFNMEAASSGTMLCRQVFSVINKGASDTLKITWTIDLGAIS